jgi:hypothetical protein
LGDASFAGGGEAGGAGAEDAADKFVGEFRGGDVEDSGDEAVGDQAFHGFAAVACRVKDQHFIAGGFQDFSGVFDAGGRHTEHRGGDQRLVGCRGTGASMGDLCAGERDHASHGSGGFGEDLAADAVDPGDVDDRVQHHDVFAADVGTRLPRCQSADHQLGDAQRQRSHGGCPDCRSGRTTECQHAVDFSASVRGRDEIRGTDGGGCHRLAAIVLLAQSGQRSSALVEEIFPTDIGRDGRFTETSRIDHASADAVVVKQVSHECDLVAFGVERSEKVNRHYLRPAAMGVN